MDIHMRYYVPAPGAETAKRFKVPQLPIVLALSTGLAGCVPSRTGCPEKILTLTRPDLEIREDGLARCRFQEAWRDDDQTYSFEREYVVQANVSRCRALHRKLQALSTMRHPELLPGEGATLRAFTDGKLTSELTVNYYVFETYPFWEGVLKEAENLAHVTLLWSLFHRDEAEWRAGRGDIHMACYSYEIAVRQALEATSRLVRESENWIIDDRGLLLREPQILEQTDKYKEALDAWRRAWIEIFSGDVRLIPGGDGAIRVVIRGPDYNRLLYHQRMISWAGLLDEDVEATEEYHELLAAYDQKVADSPNSFDYRLCLMWLRYNWAAQLAARGRGAETNALSADVHETLARLRPDLNDPVGLSDLAWFLSRCPDDRFRDADRALVLAERAVDIAPREEVCWRSLGAARFAKGDYEGAIQAFDRADEVVPDGHGAYASFYAGLACVRLGRREDALQRYEKTNELLKSQDYDYSTDHHWRPAGQDLAAALGLVEPRQSTVKTLPPPREWFGSPLVAMHEGAEKGS